MNECLNETGIIIPFCSGREGDSETMSWGPAEKLQEPHPRPLTPGHAPSTTPQSTELLRLQRGPTGALETSLGTCGPEHQAQLFQICGLCTMPLTLGGLSELEHGLKPCHA